MNMKLKDSMDIKASNRSLYLSFLCIGLILIALLITYTPLVRIYWINWIALLILSNAFNLIVIAVVLLILYRTEVKIIQKKVDDFNRKLGGK